MATKSCEVCGAPIIKRNADKFCSRACYGIAAARRAALVRPWRSCIVCGVATQRRPSHGGNVTCSPRCRRARRREVGLRLAADGKIPRVEQSPAARAAAAVRMTGAGCPKFNGYRTSGGNGGRYVLVRPPADWPWPTMIGARGYVREHRKVMAETLGRALCREEVVHHLNGDTRDNSPGNLSLYPCNSDHMADHADDGLMDRRWPACVFGCGRQAKPLGGRHFQACARCRRLVAHRSDPRRTATY